MPASASPSKGSIHSVVENLEQQLVVARKEKTLRQIPALSSLRNLVRIYAGLGIVLLLPLMLLSGVMLRRLHSAVNLTGPDVVSASSFFGYVAVSWIAAAVGTFLLFLYVRFLRQFRRNHVRDINETIVLILPTWRFVLLLSVIQIPIIAGMFRAFVASMPGGSAAVETGFGVYQMIWQSVGGVIFQFVLYFVIARYIKAARAELASLEVAEAAPVARGHYRPWRQIFLVVFVVVTSILGLGYCLSGWIGQLSDIPSANRAAVDQFLAQVSKTENASLSMQIDSETRYDSATVGPGGRVTYFFTLVNLEAADINRAAFVEAMSKELANRYRSNPSLADMRKMRIELNCIYRDKHGEDIATIVVPPPDL